MAVDQTDRKLINGLIVLGVVAAVLFFLPGYGYHALALHQEEQSQKLQMINKEQYIKHYPEMQTAHFGGDVQLPSASLGHSHTNEVLARTEEEIQREQKLIAEAERRSRVTFDSWTEIPPNEQRQPGLYFAKILDAHQQRLKTEWLAAHVECLDPNIGFDPAKYNGTVITEEIKTREYLRELYIAEKIIRLCIDAKRRQEESDKMFGFQSEAFMRIRTVTPQDSVPTGPSTLVPNPKYSKDERDTRSERFDKYKVKRWDTFIQEYPVEIVLQCDINTFMRFLYSVRGEGQFLVIRTLSIISPHMKNSAEKAENEYNDFLEKWGAKITDAEAKTLREDKHLIVRISASGMDFFDHKEYPDGLYSLKKSKPQPKSKHTMTDN